MRGLGPKLEERVLAALEQGAGERPRGRAVLLPRARARRGARGRACASSAATGTQVQLAGSARRRADSVKDLDLVAVDATGRRRSPRASASSSRSRASAPAGEAGARGRTHSGVVVELRIAKPAQLGNLLQHFTGSGAPQRGAARGRRARGLHVSEYGVLDDATGQTRTCATEEEVYELLGLAYIEPELRENRGELDAARADCERRRAASARCRS